MKLNLGCGSWLLPGFINVDLYNPKAEVKADVRSLPYADNTVDEIYACHVIEHFDFYEANKVLKEWYRVLKPGGILIIETPDLEASCKKFLEVGEDFRRDVLYSHFFAKPWIDGEVHKFLYTGFELFCKLQEIGFGDIKRVPAKRYIGREDICLGVVCRK